MATRNTSILPRATQQVIVGMKTPAGIVSVGVLLVDRDTSAKADNSVGRFRYAPSYLRRPDAVPLDPIEIPLQEGEFRFGRMGGLPSAIRDSSPDNWGRTLIRQKFAAENYTAPIAEVDYLLCSPADRSGNLHFAVDFGRDGEPQWDKRALTPERIPEMTALKEHVIEALRNPHAVQGKPYPKEMDALLTGSGGARPKVNVSTRSGTIMIKMANPLEDKASNARLEEASIRMAAAVGVTTCAVQTNKETDQDFLLVKRFDISPEGHRLQMVSAMTVLNANDAPFDRTNWSYPQFARELDRWSSQPAVDKEMLFRAMVVRAMLSDADDHPRNYALIRDPMDPANRGGGSTLGQWRLAPMYDCVVGMGRGYKAPELAMALGDRGYEISEENILSRCASFGLSEPKARQIMKEIEAQVLNDFPKILDQCQVSSQDKLVAMQGVAPLADRHVENAVTALLNSAGADIPTQKPAATAPKPQEPQPARTGNTPNRLRP
ncbi:hypothetical protein CBP36_19645 (plasmid) [Acidovorax carolinensis]|uniref:Phosphatidylinositol kinase n=1 Tax=Acidovorax carolinensis TaxID=553814 RepID=A0A240UI59_9BURK|nr:type II toxin-antitoxin system HipA family toxin [Acidovorax carolinensis]ART57120.1 hypothetical protein CBP35_19600 [Acidovorax carolinensis]ART61181.1 hypothetical protein CBP36_19645 [Acidovorax carolinensis]